MTAQIKPFLLHLEVHDLAIERPDPLQDIMLIYEDWDGPRIQPAFMNKQGLFMDCDNDPITPSINMTFPGNWYWFYVPAAEALKMLLDSYYNPAIIQSNINNLTRN